MATVILHIGDAKCGSTAIQESLKAQADPLRAQGIIYDTGADASPNHDPLRSFLGGNTRGNSVTFRALGEALFAHLSTLKPGRDETVILSSEALHRHGPEATITLLRDIFPSIHRIVVVAYLRDPDARYLSFVQQRLKGDSRLKLTNFFVPRMFQLLPDWRDHPAVDTLVVRKFHPGALVNGDVVADFAEVLRAETGIPDITLPSIRRNESLSAEQMIVMQDYRARYLRDQDGKLHPRSGRVLLGFHQFSGAGFPGTKPALNAHLRDHCLLANAPYCKALNAAFPNLNLTESEPQPAPLDLAPTDSVRRLLRDWDERIVQALWDSLPEQAARLSAPRLRELLFNIRQICDTDGTDQAQMARILRYNWHKAGLHDAVAAINQHLE